MIRSIPLVSIAIALLLLPAPAPAASCTLVRVTPLAFGPYSPFGIRSGDWTGEIVFRCSSIRPEEIVRISLSPGRGAQGWSRRMECPGGALAYQLYLDRERTRIWGDGSGGTFDWRSEGPVPPGVDVVVPVYGRVFAGQNVGACTFDDQVEVTLLY